MRRVAAVLEVELLGHCLLPARREGDRTQPRMNPVDLLREQIEGAAPDVLQAMVRTFAQALMPAEADATCGAGYGRPSDERVNFRNGYRPPGEWDTRAGTTDLAIPKRRSGLYFPVPQPALDSAHLGRGDDELTDDRAGQSPPGRRGRGHRRRRVPGRCGGRGGPAPAGGTRHGSRRSKDLSLRRTTKAKARGSHSLPLLTYSAQGGLRQDPGLAAESAAGHSTDEEMGGPTWVCCRCTGDAATLNR